MVVDSIYYGKFVCTPLNIILYNVFGKGGPNLYGEYGIIIVRGGGRGRGGGGRIVSFSDRFSEH